MKTTYFALLVASMLMTPVGWAQNPQTVKVAIEKYKGADTSEERLSALRELRDLGMYRNYSEKWSSPQNTLASQVGDAMVVYIEGRREKEYQTILDKLFIPINGIAKKSADPLDKARPEFHFFESFRPITPTPTLNRVLDLQSADMDGDGNLDILYSTQSAFYPRVTVPGVTIIPNLGLGQLGNQNCFYPTQTGSAPESLTTMDIDGDGKKDIVVAEAEVTSLLVLRNLGSFDPNGCLEFESIRFPTLPEPVAVRPGDFNGDGLIDIAVSHIYSHQIRIHLNKGKAQGKWLGFTESIFVAHGLFTLKLEVADMDSNGKPDIVFLQRSLAGGPTIAWNDGVSCQPGFQNCQWNGQITFLMGNTVQPTGLSIGNFNGDPRPDLAVSFRGRPVHVFLYTGLRTYLDTVPSNTFGENATDLTSGDFNGNGTEDIAVTKEGSNRISILPRNRSYLRLPYWGQKSNFDLLEDQIDPNISKNPEKIIAVDLDLNGKSDLLTINPRRYHIPGRPDDDEMSILSILLSN